MKALRFVPSRRTLILVASAVCLSAGATRRADALPSWSKLYKMGCTGCHSTMPRLNYFGEKLMLRGNEIDRMNLADLPKGHIDILTGSGSAASAAKCSSCHNDGTKYDDAGGAKVAERLTMHNFSNLFSVRYKVTALSTETNKLTEGAEKKTKVTVAKGDWLQLWVGGPIAKNLTIRAEVEVSEGATVGLHNYALAYSNVFGPEGAVNLRVGGFTHGEWLSISDQKRAFAPHFSIYEYKSAKGSGEDAYKIAGAEPGIEMYGYKGPVVYQVGVSNGKSASDVNSDLNYWTTGKVYLATSGTFAGSSLSASYVTGTDSKNSALATIQKDPFRRYIVSSGLRAGALDLAGSYLWGSDDNWTLNANRVKSEVRGGFVQMLFTATDKITPGFIYQSTNADDAAFDKQRLLMGINFYLRQNTFISTYYDYDLQATNTTYPLKQHVFAVQLRGGF